MKRLLGIFRFMAVLTICSAWDGLALADDHAKLETYPVKESVWLGTYGGEIVVEPELELKTSRQGYLEWKVKDGEMVKKGQVLAVQDAKAVDRSRRRLEISRSNLTLSHRQAEIKHAEKKESLLVQQSELALSLAELEFGKEEKEVLGKKILAKVAEERLKLKKKSESLQKQLDPELLKKQLDLELKSLDLEFENQEAEYEKLVESNTVYAEYAGQVLIKKEAGRLRSAEVFGLLKQTGFAELKLPIVDPRVKSLPIAEVLVKVHRPDGKFHIGEFKEKEAKGGLRNGTVVYTYSLSPKDGQPVPADLNGSHLVTIDRALAKPCYLIPKTPFLFKNTEEVRKKGWHKFVRERFGAKANLLYVGPRALAVEK